MAPARSLLLAAPLLALAACEMPEPPPPEARLCRAAELQWLVGTPVRRFDPAAVAGPVRVLAPESVMTMDHNPTRLNIYHDARGRVTQVTCG